MKLDLMSIVTAMSFYEMMSGRPSRKQLAREEHQRAFMAELERARQEKEDREFNERMEQLTRERDEENARIRQEFIDKWGMEP